VSETSLRVDKLIASFQLEMRDLTNVASARRAFPTQSREPRATSYAKSLSLANSVHISKEYLW